MLQRHSDEASGGHLKLDGKRQPIYVLYGVAGIGKSTMSKTVAERATVLGLRFAMRMTACLNVVQRSRIGPIDDEISMLRPNSMRVRGSHPAEGASSTTGGSVDGGAGRHIVGSASAGVAGEGLHVSPGVMKAESSVRAKARTAATARLCR